MNEFWLPAPGYVGRYAVSDLGRVKSLPRIEPRGSWTISVRGRVLRAGITSVGYPLVVLCGEGKPKSVMVHRLVAQAFLGDPPSKHEVDHRNGRRDDNRAENLRWVTRSQNNLNRYPYAAGAIK